MTPWLHHAALVACLIAAPAAAQEMDSLAVAPGVTADQLARMCLGDGPIDQRACILYVRGLMVGIKLGQAPQKAGHPLCLPAAPSPIVGRLAVKRLFEEQPAGRALQGDTLGDTLAYMALAERFACPDPPKP